jgi:hypothetical protein
MIAAFLKPLTFRRSRSRLQCSFKVSCLGGEHVKTRGTIETVAAVIGCVMLIGFGAGAQTEGLQLVPPELVPESATFWLIQMEGPFPYDPSPGLPVYALEDGTFVVDDSAAIYPTQALSSGMAAQDSDPMPPEEGDPGGGGGSWSGPVDYGCSLWLGVSLSNDVAVVTLNNTRPGQTYTIWSTEDLSPDNWLLETNIVGDVGNVTQTNILLNQRTNLFLRASESRYYVTNAVFLGLDQTNTGASVPDTMGAVGPDHFVELLNGTGTKTAIAVYDKLSGDLISQASMSNFFAVEVSGTNYPRYQMTDPRILFDHQSHRWVASAIEQGDGIVILAVSNDDSPTNLATGWSNYVFHVRAIPGEPSVDYDTLGVDANGIYLSVLRIGMGHSVLAIKKPEIYAGTNLSTQLDVTNGLISWTIQPAVNFDDVPTNGYTWFVAKGPPDAGTNYQGGPILYRRLQWQGTNVVWADTNWVEVTNPGSDYQDYYEFSGTNFGSIPGPGISAPQLGTTIGIDLYSIGSRLMMATIRNGFVWTCQTVGLSGTNGAYTGDASGTNVDRSALQWLTLEIKPDDSGLTMSDRGRIFDTAETNAWWYYFPSLAVNCPGDMVMGFSGSSATNYIGAFYTWRLAQGTALEQARLIRPGTTNTLNPSWGDYSATTLDPVDDWSFWTVQEHAAPVGAFKWQTTIARLRPNP